MIKLIKYQILIIIIIILSGCFNKNLVIENSLPRSKIVVQKDPDKEKFYSATYESISQEIYDKNIKIYVLQNSKNDIELDKSIEKYAIYFILPNKLNINDQWKYLINTDATNEFSISSSGIIKKI